MKQMMRMKTVLFMLTSLLMTICPVFGKSFTLDLRQTAHKGAAARLLAATPREDGEIRAVNLDAGVADVGEVAVGDELTFTLFDDVTLKLKLKEKMPAPFGGDAFLAEVAGYEGIKTAVVLCTGDGLTINVQDFRNNRLYKVVSSPTGVTVKEIEPVRGGSCGNDALTPHRASSRAEASSAVGAPPVLSAATGAKLLPAAGQPDTCVDVLVAYDGNAQSWARQNGGGLTNFAQVAVQRMNAALANTGLDASFRFRLVGVTTVAVTADDVHTALYAIDGDEAGWAAIKAARETCGADIVTTLIDTGSAYGTTGVGWSLASTSSLDSFKDSAYNVCAIRSVAQSDTMAHECGHNMGAGHSDVQTSSPGPQLYDYSSGYFFAANGTAYSTIMSYAQENPSGAATTGIPYFSSPNYVYNGAAVGDSTHDNTRTLAGTYAHVVNWRAQKVPMSYDVVFEPASGELFNGSLAVTLTPGKAGTEIRYTLDGSTPTASSPRYTGPITLRETTTIKAATVVNGVCSLPYTASYYSDDDLGYALGLPDCDWTATGDWRVQSTNTVDGVGVETPGAERNAVATLSTRIVGPASLAFSLRQRGYYEVTVLCDGTPIWSCGSTWNSSWREESTDIPEGAHDVTISVKTAYGYSGCFFGLDDLRVYLVRKPVFTPQTGASSATACTFTGEQMIEIAAPDEGATIYYTLDGSSPTGESATLYEGPFFITESAKVKAVAMVPGKGESPLAEGWFVERHTPVAGEWTLWGEGAYEAVQQDGRLIAELCWNLLGCGWSQALEPVATDPLFTTWAAANGVYLFTPTWRDKTGTGSRFGSLYSQTALYEELEHYTYYPTFVLAKPDDLTTCVGTILARNDGVHGADGIQYNGTANSLIACFASFFGTSPLAAPVASATDAAGRSFPFNVTLTNPNGAGTIYYTLDGTAPTRANGTRYTGAITILASGTTLKAVVWPDGDDAVSSIPLAVTYEDLSDAIAIDGVTWQNDVAYPWTVSRTTKGVTLSGYRDLSLTSGSVTSTLKATLQGPGVFHYKYNFQPFYSTLKFKMNGETVDEWRYVQIRDGSTNIVVTASGTTEFEWVYDYSYQDAAYSFLVCEMSDITWTPYAAPSAPAGLTASDGEYAYGTLLRWEKASGADSYSIYRGTTSSPAAAEKIGSTQKNMYWDTGAAPGRTYWYWIKAVNEYGESNVSNSASGRRQGSAVSTYTITYAPGADGTGTEQTDTKTEDIALTLKGAIFTRTGYTQTGWATSDGGEKTYDLGASYTANAAATLYPFWTVDYEAGYTTTTDVHVPYAWLLTHGTVVGGDYEAAAHATAANGRKIWTCYALGLDPANPSDDFRITKFWMDGHKPMFEYSHTTDGSGKSFEEYINKLGKAKLTDKWQLVPADGNSAFRFFTVEVVFPGGTSIAVSRDKVQLWEGGPYWATTNIGAESPEDPGYYFWWGDTVGYKRKGDAWVASDGSESNFSFEEANTPTYGKDIATLQSEGWITADGVLAPEHDAAHAQWGGDWRMPTLQELSDLNNNCDWTWTTQNGVNGYIVRGQGNYASNSIFLPAVGTAFGTSLGYYNYGGSSYGEYWSSVSSSGVTTCPLTFDSGGRYTYYGDYRVRGMSVRPVQGFSGGNEPIWTVVDGELTAVDLNGCTDVTIPDGVTSIGSSAFYGCSGLTSVSIPSSVTRIGSAPFFGCSGLMSISVDSGNVNYKSVDGLLLSKDGKTLIQGVNGDVTIPNSVTRIEYSAFGNYGGLTSVTIPDSVTYIGSQAFYNCRGLKSIVIPDSVTSLGYLTFGYCSGLTSVTLPNTMTSIGSSAFSHCSGLTNVTIPDTVTSIGAGAFEGCSGLTSIAIPNSVTSIGDYVFEDCAGLTSVTIPGTVTNIGQQAFTRCSSLANVTMPNSVTNIGNHAFSGCSSLTSVTIPNSVMNIGEYVFKDCADLTSITIPNSVTNVGYEAFSGCIGLTSLTIPNSVTSIGTGAFYSCSGLTSVTIGSGATSIGEVAFFGCSGLTSVTIPASMTSIEDRTFWLCSGLTIVTIPNSVTNIGYEAFCGCSSLASVRIPNSVTSIGNRAFFGCSGLTSVTMEGDCPTVGDYAFDWADPSCVVRLPKGNDTYVVAGGKWQGMTVEYHEAGASGHDKVQLWEGGPYWATTNIGAENPEDSGYYFWWGDTVGYKRESDAWVASDGSSSNFSFEEANTPTYGKNIATLQSEGWITADGVLAPEHDAAHVQWGGNWRMPTDQELTDLNDNCDWTSATQNGVSGYVVRGRGAYASNSIFLPASDYGEGASLGSSGPEEGGCWSSIPYSYNSGDRSWYFYFSTFGNITYYYYDRYIGFPVRPVQGFAQ